jgi:hypothetical protein
LLGESFEERAALKSELSATLEISEPDELVSPGPFSMFLVGRGLSSDNVLILMPESHPVQFLGQAPSLFVAVKARYAGERIRPGTTTWVTGSALNPSMGQGQMFVGLLAVSASAPLDLYEDALR